MTVWKVGCRWSENGNADSKIISVFRRNGVIFVGNKKDPFSQIKKDDLIAIADGYTIISIAKATCREAKPLKELNVKIRIRKNERNIIDEEWAYENAIGITAKIFDLPPSDILQYKKRGSCFRASDQIANKIEELYNKCAISYDEFDIECKRADVDSLLNSKVHYVIPVYQREYSWGEPQITKFIRDLLMGLCGVSGLDEEDSDEKRLIPKEKASPMFIGTMQLSFRKHITNNEYEQDVIDGQQRFSTILCLLKYLSLCRNISDIPFNEILESRVNRGKEDELLNEAMSIESLEKLKDDFYGNKYLENIKLIKECLEESCFPSEYYEKLETYIRKKIWFVVISTKAGISKTLEIFNTINTAGLDLNGGDLFKVRLYEYLKEKTGTEQFDGIDGLYNRIKEKNIEWRKNHDYDLINIDMVRDIYKTYLIANFDLPKLMHSWGNDRFYDMLFDVCLGVAPHDELKSERAQKVDLNLEDLNRVVDAIIFWNSRKINSQEKMIADLLVEKSRYSRYWKFPILYLLFTENSEGKLNEIYELWQVLARIFFAYSIYRAKIVNDGITFMHNIYSILHNRDFSKLESTLQERLKSSKWMIEDVLGKVITDNRKKKDLICIVSAYLKEPLLKEGSAIEELKCRLSWGFDVEHIHATEDYSVNIDEKLQNSIGNLMLLEYSINRSIGKKPFNEKLKYYKNSKYAVVQQMAAKTCWTSTQIQERLEEEKKVIIDFYNQPIIHQESPTL